MRQLAQIGVLPSDSEELRLRKAVLVLSSTLMATLAFIWVATYAALGLWVSAAIPFAYQLASLASICTFARTRRYRVFRRSQLWMTLVLPFALQWSLGGFANSSAVSLWAFTAPLGALLFVGAREGIPWFLGFVALVAVSAAIDPALADRRALPPPRGGRRVLRVEHRRRCDHGLRAAPVLRPGPRARAGQVRAAAAECPARAVAARLKEGDGTIADACPEVTVLFADIVGFTPLSERLPAAKLVGVLDSVFARWDALARDLGVEKIKTIGDAYMVAAGIPLPREDHSEAIAEMALAMGPEVARVAAETGLALEVRIGIDSGPVVAGVIGRAKFSYDLWGDTVNTASRMESHAAPATIQVSPRAHALLNERYELRPRGTIEIKGKGTMSPYLLLGPREKQETSTHTPEKALVAT